MLTTVKNLWKNHAIGSLMILVALYVLFYFTGAELEEYLGVSIVGATYIAYYYVSKRWSGTID